MRIAVWTTGHPICDIVAQSLARGFNANIYHVSQLTDDIILSHDIHIVYGILRGASEVFRVAERLGRDWYNVDKGFFDAGHFSGTYRISYRGTQARWPGARHPLRSLGSRVLVAPPTADVCEFFGIDLQRWLYEHAPPNATIRHKHDDRPIDWNISGLVTFNSSLGWQALEHGIAVHSDPQHSTVGSFFLDHPQDDVHIDCEQLFRFMRNNQYTLKEIESGDAWNVISVLTLEKQSVPMSPPTAS